MNCKHEDKLKVGRKFKLVNGGTLYVKIYLQCKNCEVVLISDYVDITDNVDDFVVNCLEPEVEPKK